MDKVVQKFGSHKEAEEAELDYMLSLSPQERLEILLQLIDDFYGPQPRLERVCRIIKLSQS